jgi:hypothetical protein
MGTGVVDGRVAYFRAYYANNPCASVIDAVLSVQWNWKSRVAPAVKGWIQANPACTLSTLAAAGPGARVGEQPLRPAHDPAIVGTANALLSYGKPADTDQQRFGAWAQQAQAMRYHHEYDPVGEVPGIGIALFNYLLMRGGVDALKPDSHIKAHLVSAGLARSLKVSDSDTLMVAEAMAEELEVGRLWFDQLLW